MSSSSPLSNLRSSSDKFKDTSVAFFCLVAAACVVKADAGAAATTPWSGIVDAIKVASVVEVRSAAVEVGAGRVGAGRGLNWAALTMTEETSRSLDNTVW